MTADCAVVSGKKCTFIKDACYYVGGIIIPKSQGRTNSGIVWSGPISLPLSLNPRDLE